MSGITPVSKAQGRIRNALRQWKYPGDKNDLELFGDFVAAVIVSLRGPYLAQNPPRKTLQSLFEAFEFIRCRKPGTVLTEIRNRNHRGITVFNCMDNQPFIVDTARLFLTTHESDYVSGFNLIFTPIRDAKGNLTAIDSTNGHRESVIRIEAHSTNTMPSLRKAQRALQQSLQLSQLVVSDFSTMTDVVQNWAKQCIGIAKETKDGPEVAIETAEFLQWLLTENFVFMGVEANTPYGIQRTKGTYHASPKGTWPTSTSPRWVQVRKSDVESPVHRAGKIDEILITLPNGDTLFLRGMFTYRAMTQPSRNVPILRHVLQEILIGQDLEPGSYLYKGIANVFDSLPTEFLFTANTAGIAGLVELVFESEQKQEVGFNLLPTDKTTAFCLVVMPKSIYNDELRQELEHTICDTLGASYSSHGVFVSRYDVVLLHYFMTGITRLRTRHIEALQVHVRHIASPWHTRLWTSLCEHFEEAIADRLADTYGDAFPSDWRRNTSTDRTVRDIQKLTTLGAHQKVSSDVFEGDDQELYLRLYQSEDVYLTDILPVLDDFALIAKDAFATVVKPKGGTLYLDTFRLEESAEISRKALLDQSAILSEALTAIFDGRVDSDSLNQLVLSAGLNWQEVDVLRGYVRYCRQLPIKLSQDRMDEILTAHPKLCKLFIQLFHGYFNPEIQKGEKNKAQLKKIQGLLNDKIRLLRSHDVDLCFSTMKRLVDSTLRTNFYLPNKVEHYLSFKFDHRVLHNTMGQGPLFEVYVHHKFVEGVHFRFSHIARGGIRWSDRDDFRTEVMGLATTQQVKNVVIVPTGAKGGFFLKKASRDRGVRRKEADHYYAIFMRGLLDLADNQVGTKVVKPDELVCRDAKDTYLVVAADKGTAHLSDTANSISQEYGYWLDDAYASGGSNGYDHKELGITARGAWVLVKRHFSEMNHDIRTEPFTCVGIGDMGGDVFGNGLIESNNTRLLGAFNHLHIFLDPDPDPRTSYKERMRLFKARGGWDQYDTKKISKGGGVFDRRAKSIKLSKTAQALLELDEAETTPEHIIRRMLKMDVDLLWNGGIGTYVKASTESHTDADDRANNALRINGCELRAKILGEGGNLGITPKARIEAALHGVRLNADFIDNSGGVDLSDHEVNLKILLKDIQSSSNMSDAERNHLLASLSDDVAQLVLDNSAAHGRQISRDVLRSKQDIFQFGRAIAFIEQQFQRDRRDLSLPDNEELVRRAKEGIGLTRPEVATLSAWIKMFVYQALLDDGAKKIPGYDDYLMSYFPLQIREKYPDNIRKHMLAKEIVMTVLSTQLITDAGAAFIPVTIESTGASVQRIVTAYLHGQKLARVGEVRSTLEVQRGKVPLETLSKAWLMVDESVQAVAMYWLSARTRVPTDEELQEMLQGTEAIYELQTKKIRHLNVHRLNQLKGDGLSIKTATIITKAKRLPIALLIWAEAKNKKMELTQVAMRHMAIAGASHLTDVIEDLSHRPASGKWDPIAITILEHRFHELLRRLVSKTPVPDDFSSADALEETLSAGVLKDVRSQVEQLFGDDGTPSVATLMVLEERLSAAIRRIPAP